MSQLGGTWRRTDALVAGCGVFVCAGMGFIGQPDWLWSSAMAVFLVLRRSAPVVFAVLATAISVAHFVVDTGLLLPGDLILLVAVYSVAVHASERLRSAGLLLGAVFVAVLVSSAQDARDLLSIVLPAALVSVSVIAAWAVGLLERRKVGALRDLEQRRILVERDAEVRSRLAVFEERERISDDMHDVLAHTLTGVVVQAESGRVIAPNREMAALFANISSTSRAALQEVRGLLSPDAGPDTHQTPGIEELEDLIASFAPVGLNVDLTQTGNASSLTPGMSLAVYRVIQESLTNALRHGAASTARLNLAWTAEELTVSIVNPLDASARHGPLEEHRGLGGIRRRCELHGGRAQIAAGHDFTVATAWPLTSRNSQP